MSATSHSGMPATVTCMRADGSNGDVAGVVGAGSFVGVAATVAESATMSGCGGVVASAAAAAGADSLEAGAGVDSLGAVASAGAEEESLVAGVGDGSVADDLVAAALPADVLDVAAARTSLFLFRGALGSSGIGAIRTMRPLPGPAVFTVSQAVKPTAATATNSTKSLVFIVPLRCELAHPLGSL